MKGPMKTDRILLFASLLLSASLLRAQDVYNFEGESIKESAETAIKQSQHFVFTLTGDGDTDNMVWEIKQDGSAPSPKNVLAIVKADAVDTGFPMALLKASKFQDFDLSVKFKIVGGNVNQAAGLVFRGVDADHCYFVRASAVDNSVVLMKVNKKQRTKLASAKVNIGTGRWNSLRVVTRGSEMDCYYNDTKVFTAHDVDYPLGKVGMVTQADSITYFDDFTVNTGAPK